MTSVSLLGGVLGGLAMTSFVGAAPARPQAARPVTPGARPVRPAARPVTPGARPVRPAARPVRPVAHPVARPAAPVGPRFVQAAGKTAELPEGIGVALTIQGEVLLKRGQRPMIRVSLGSPPPAVPRAPLRVSSALVNARQGGRDHLVLHVTAEGVGSGEGGRLEAALWLRGPRATLIWAGATGALGDFGAFTRELSVTPRGVALYQRTRGLMRCDGLPARMLSQGFHFASGRLLPLLGQPPEAEGAVELTATTRAPVGLRAEPLAPFRFDSATSELGCSGDAGRVSPPSELHDGRPHTAWVEGSGGPGRWEYATAQGVGRARPVLAVRILPGHAGSVEKLRAHHRLKVFWLLLGPKYRYRVTIPSDPAAGPTAAGPAAAGPAAAGPAAAGPTATGPATPPATAGTSSPAAAGPAAATSPLAAYWVILPSPVVSRCITLMIDQVYPGPSGDTAVSELTVFTSLDFGNPLQTVLRAVTAGTLDREEAVRTLGGLGAAELPALRAALPKAASSAEQEVILRVLAERDPLGSVEALVAGLSDASGGFRLLLVDALVRAGDRAVPALASLLSARRIDPELARDVTRALARIGTLASAKALAERLGLGDRERRRLAVEAFSAFPLQVARTVLWAQLARGDLSDPRRGDLLRSIKGLASRHPGLGSAAAALVLTLSGRVLGFEARYRLLELAAALGDSRLAVPLIALLRSKEDPILRELAALALGRSPDRSRVAALGLALADPSPRVRRGAVLGWAVSARRGELLGGAALAAVLGLADREPWTFVREVAIAALGEACPAEAHALLLRLGARVAPRAPAQHARGAMVPRSSMSVRRLALLAALRCRVPGLGPLLGRILRDQDDRTAMRALAVRLVAEQRDRTQVPYLSEFLELLAKEVKRPRTRNEAFAADIALALGRLGDRRALAALNFAASVRRLSQLQAAALEALGSFCDARSRPVVEQGRRSADRVVVGTANRTAQRCGW